MRIRDESSAIFALRHYSEFRNGIDDSTRQLSSGSRINAAGDDAAGLGVSDRMQTQSNGSRRASQNIQEGISMLQVADGGLSVIEDLLQRARTLAVQAANDTLTSSDRSLVQMEIDQIILEIDRQASATKYNGKALINGEDTTIYRLHVGANRDEIVTLDFPSVNATTLGVSTQSVATRSSAENAISVFGNAVDQLNAHRADIGALELRLERSGDFIRIQEENQRSSFSRIRDLDFSEGVTDLARRQVLLQSSGSAAAQSHVMHNSVLSLLSG